MVQGVESGRVLIGVISRDPAVPAATGPRRGKDGTLPPPPAQTLDRSKWFPLPLKYEDPTKSGLSTTLKSGASTYDIDLP
jgi:hypothetical protein